MGDTETVNSRLTRCSTSDEWRKKSDRDTDRQIGRDRETEKDREVLGRASLRHQSSSLPVPFREAPNPTLRTETVGHSLTHQRA